MKYRYRYCDDVRSRVSPLHHVMARGSTADVLQVLDQRYCSVNVIDSAKQTPLYYAIYRGFRTGVHLLLERGARLDVQDEDGNTPFHFAVKWGFKDIVCDLLAKKADTEVKNKYGQNVLHYAIVWNYRKSFEDVVDLLLKSGADVNAIDKDGETPLHCAAARRDSKSVCNLLFLRGASVSAKDKKGNTPLHTAAMRLCKDAIDSLIEHGADLEDKNHEGDTPLHCAVKSTVIESVEILLAKGANVNAVNLEGQSPLHLASKGSKKNIMEVLLEKGADIEQKDHEGDTALHTAAVSASWNDNGACVEFLIENGAKVKTKNNYDETPIFLALAADNHESAINLMNWGTSFLGNNNDFFELFLMPISYHPCIKELLEIHIIKLKCAGINVMQKCYDVLTRTLEFAPSLEAACNEEVKKMKATKFGTNSLFDIFTNYADPVFLSNEELEKKVNSVRFSEAFPIYSLLIKTTLKRELKRLFLLDNALAGLQSLWPLKEVILPNEIMRKILTYLHEDNLESVIAACKA